MVSLAAAALVGSWLLVMPVKHFVILLEAKNPVNENSLAEVKEILRFAQDDKMIHCQLARLH